MTTLEKIKAEIQKLMRKVRILDTETQKAQMLALAWCLEIIGKYAEQEPTGHWITEDMFDGDVAYRCSECNELFWIESGTPKDNEYNFCPKCGARMVEPQESEVSDADSN